MEFEIREAEEKDLCKLLELYTNLHDNPFPVIDAHVENIWSRMMKDTNHHILLGCIDEKFVSSCVIDVIENLTHKQRPYAVIENVITSPDYRNCGYASLVLSAAKEIAVKRNCYKMMLMTSSKQESTFQFYKRAGYNSNDKTAFVQWL